MKFIKMHGAGNDYIYIDCFSENIEKPESLSKTLSRRHFGVGADGMVLIKPSIKADCFMDIYNSDGSRAEMCGNAIRCVAKYIYDYKNKRDFIKIDTLSGVKMVEICSKNGVATGGKVNMGKPVFAGHQIPTRYGDSIVKDKVLKIDNREYKVTCLSMGNPHCVIFCDHLEKIDLKKIGGKIECHEMFPERINVEFAQIVSPTQIKMRVWERGSGETLSCGTGACAVSVASVINGFSKQNAEIEINLPGGNLTVCWQENNNVFLSGEATEVFKGEINI